jgi:hypothetical protein|tara:strand:+ start:317 stop:502 length:186 start_codon:yes stop_codon:yes gene_type:complete
LKFKRRTAVFFFGGIDIFFIGALFITLGFDITTFFFTTGFCGTTRFLFKGKGGLLCNSLSV